MPSRNGDAETVIPNRTTEKDEEYLVVLTIENLGQAFQQLTDDSFVSRMVGHNPGAELIEVAWTFHSKGQAGVFLPLDGHLNMVGTLNLGNNDLENVNDVTAGGDVGATGDVSSGGQFLADNGDATAPGYAFTDTTNKGMFAAANEISLTNNGSTVFVHNSSTDRFGYGTDSPSYGHDFHTADSTGFRFYKTTAGANIVLVDAFNGDARLQFARGSSIKHTIGNDGSESDSFQIVGGNALGANVALAVDASQNVAIGGPFTASASLLVNQASSSGAEPCLELDQDDADVEFIEFDGTEGADTSSSISTLTTSGAVQKHIQITVNGTTYWLAALANPS